MREARNTPTPRRRPAESGFSLIELMVVITIIGLLAGIVGVNVVSYMKRASIGTTKATMIKIENEIKSFRVVHRRLPDALEDLLGEDGFLEGDEVPIDAWGNPFIYEKQGNLDYILMSLGADGVEGGEGEAADIDRAEAHKQSGGDEE